MLANIYPNSVGPKVNRDLAWGGSSSGRTDGSGRGGSLGGGTLGSRSGSNSRLVLDSKGLGVGGIIRHAVEGAAPEATVGIALPRSTTVGMEHTVALVTLVPWLDKGKLAALLAGTETFSLGSFNVEGRSFIKVLANESW